MKKKESLTLLEYLTKTGITQKFLATKIGVSPESLNRLVKRGFTPTLKLALDIEKATNGEVSVYSWDTSKGSEAKETKKTNNDKDKNSKA